jgi:hypothetical protein
MPRNWSAIFATREWRPDRFPDENTLERSMMEDQYSTQKLLLLRKLTRAIADQLRNQLKEYLGALGPLFRPRLFLGPYVQGGTKEPAKAPERAFSELRSLYEKVAGSKPFNVSPELKTPLPIESSSLELAPVEYNYAISTTAQSKTVVVTSPLKWVLTYAGFPLGRLKTLLAERAARPLAQRDLADSQSEELERFILHFAVLHVAVSTQPGIGQILDGLSFPLSSERAPELGDLPLLRISAPVATLRPPDEVIIESTEISGRDAFDEVVDILSIRDMRLPLKDRLIELVRSHDQSLLAG